MSEISISLAIQHTPWSIERRMFVTEIIKQLGGQQQIHKETVGFWIEKDIDRAGCAPTFLKAIRRATLQTSSHFLLLQDDVKLCNNFLHIINQIIKANPTGIICLTTYGSSLPWIEKHQQLCMKFIEENNQCLWIRSHSLRGAALIIPQIYLSSFLKWYSLYVKPNRRNGIDVLLGAFGGLNDIETLHVIPNPVLHLGRYSENLQSYLNNRACNNLLWHEDCDSIDWSIFTNNTMSSPCRKVPFNTVKVSIPQDLYTKLLQHPINSQSSNTNCLKSFLDKEAEATNRKA